MKLIVLLLIIACSTSKPMPLPPGNGTTDNSPTTPSEESPPSPETDEPESESVCKPFTIRPESLKAMPELAMVSKKAECVLKNPLFHAAIIAHGKFTYTDKTGEQIVADIKGCHHATLRTYYKRFGSVVAYRNVGESDIYFNTKFAGNSVEEKVNTAVHELLHVKGYSHPFNYTNDRPSSVPYMVGTIAQKFSDSCDE